ncbi:MAG: fatty acid desaturase, partial [Hyphomicrobiaceae bacterium]|nr:fatty acid desaturase [Hyphomicrobiaceae bacterium]
RHAYPDVTRDAPYDPARQSRIGLTLAIAIVIAWIGLHIATVFFFPLSLSNAPLAVLIVAVQTWLYVGMFIIAHDCMHGSLVPFRPWANQLAGRICLFLYAGFFFDELNRAHHRHHRHSGTAGDPDFDDHPPHGYWRWFAKFFLEYFSLKQVAILVGVFLIYTFAFNVSQWNALIFWGVPGVLSALQLFTFGTYLPHKPGASPFPDRHNARTNDLPTWLSLLTCFHFGYHHEHHLYPTVPWWRLPSVRTRRDA